MQLGVNYKKENTRNIALRIAVKNKPRNICLTFQVYFWPHPKCICSASIFIHVPTVH